VRRLIALGGLSILIACGAAPTATLAPYGGPRTHGYPTPGQFTSTTGAGGTAALTVRGVRQAVVAAYLAAWRADGWRVASARDGSGGASIIFERATVLREVVFRDRDDGATDVTLPPP
jgi:hypothetical protein